MAIVMFWSTSTIQVLVLLVGNAVVVTTGYTLDDLDRLLDNKRERYNVMVRPKYNLSEPLTVSVEFRLIAIRDFDEVAEKLSTFGVLNVSWKDDRLPWDPWEYAGLDTFVIDQTEFWTPPLFLSNAFERLEKIGKDPYWPMTVNHEGYVTYSPGEVFTTTCAADVELYPWDIQTCELSFVTWGGRASMNGLKLLTTREKVGLGHFIGNGEWDLVGTEASIKGNRFAVDITMQRKPLFILVNTMVPIVLMSVLNIMAFVIPLESGERISYCVTVLLAIAVFMTVVNEELPRSATTIAFLCYYLVCVLGLSMTITFVNIINNRIHTRDDTQEMNKYWSAFVRFIWCRCLRKPLAVSKLGCQQKYSPDSTREQRAAEMDNCQTKKDTGLQNNATATLATPTLNTVSTIATSDNPTEINRGVTATRSTKDIGNCSITNGKIYTDVDKDGDCKITWKDVSSCLDIAFGLLSLVCLLLFTGTFFIYTVRVS